MQEASTGMEGARQGALCHGWAGMLRELLSLDAPGLIFMLLYLKRFLQSGLMYRDREQDSPGCKPLSLLPGPQQFYGQWHIRTIRTFVSLECWRCWSSLTKIDSLTVGEGRLLSATHGPCPFQVLWVLVFICMAGSAHLSLCWELLQWYF